MKLQQKKTNNVNKDHNEFVTNLQAHSGNWR